MGQIILPPNYPKIAGPLIFLAGPIQGAPDWQSTAISYLKDHADVHIASPRRPKRRSGDFTKKDYNEQVDWEHHFLDYAAENGITVFWLAKQDYEVKGRAYAQTSRLELGEAFTRHYLKGIQLIVGIEQGFSNEKYIRRTLAQKCPSVPVCSYLDETLEHAVKLLP